MIPIMGIPITTNSDFVKDNRDAALRAIPKEPALKHLLSLLWSLACRFPLVIR